jgi:glycosyltransferase involved in cell wall biosynthesis
MKFLFVVPRFHTNLYFVVKALQRRGHEVEMVVEADGPDFGMLRPIVLDRPFGAGRALDILRQIQPDLLVLRQRRKDWQWFYWFGPFLSQRRVGYDQQPYERPRRFAHVLRMWLARRPLYRITPVRARGAKQYPPDDLAFYVPFPVEVPGSVRTRAYGSSKGLRILCVGKLNQPRKRQLMLIETLSALAGTYDFRLTLAGSSTLDASGADRAYFEEIRAYQSSGALAGRLDIIENKPFEEMQSLYLGHDVIVLPSEKEPLGTAPLEAMGCGCVPVISDDCGSAAYVTPECGFVFPSGDGKALQAVLERLLSEPALVERLGKKAVETVEQDYTLDLCADRFEAIARGTAVPGSPTT